MQSGRQTNHLLNERASQAKLVIGFVQIDYLRKQRDVSCRYLCLQAFLLDIYHALHQSREYEAGAGLKEQGKWSGRRAEERLKGGRKREKIARKERLR